MTVKVRLLFIVIACCGFSFVGNVTTDSYTGYAYEEGSTELVYTEEFSDKFINGNLIETQTEYFAPNHSRIAERTLDFRKSKYAPDFKTVDLRTGYMEGATLEGTKVRLFVRKNENASLEEKVLDVPQPIVIDGGFNQFIKSNWDKLESNKHITFHFVVPAKLQYYKLRATTIALNDKAMKVKVEPDNKLLRWLADPIIITYNIETKRIISYEGKSNIADENGANFTTRLVYPKKGP